MLHYLYRWNYVFYFIVTHSSVPSSMVETIIVPIVGNKYGNISDNNNYRSTVTVLAIIISKLFESANLLKFEIFLDACPNQCSF